LGDGQSNRSKNYHYVTIFTIIRFYRRFIFLVILGHKLQI